MAKGGAFDVILSDMRMPGISGLDILRQLRDLRVDSAFIIMTGFGTVDTAVEAMKLGAVDFVQKPFFRDELLMRVRSATERRQLARQVDLLQRQVDPPASVGALIGSSQQMVRVKDLIARAGAAPRHGAHHGRDRHRQGAGGAGDSCRQQPRPEAVRGPELRGAHRIAARERAVRPRARRLHRRGRGARRADRACARRHALPRRDWHHAEDAAGQAAAVARIRRGAPHRRERDAARRRPLSRGHQSRHPGARSIAATSAATCSIASTCTASICRRSASAETTSGC